MKYNIQRRFPPLTATRNLKKVDILAIPNRPKSKSHLNGSEFGKPGNIDGSSWMLQRVRNAGIELFNI
jgi:hypothetical protein